MKEIILSYMEDADRGHLKLRGRFLTDSERELAILLLGCILADAKFKEIEETK